MRNAPKNLPKSKISIEKELVRKLSSNAFRYRSCKDETPQHSHFVVVVTIGVQLEEHGSYFKVALINLLSSRLENSK